MKQKHRHVLFLHAICCGGPSSSMIPASPGSNEKFTAEV